MRRILVTCGLACIALLALPAAGHAADGGELARFADSVAAAWVPHQSANGTFVDPVTGRGAAYGTVMIGYALMRAGVRRDDPQLVAAGIKAFNSRLRLKSHSRSYFLMLPFAKGYVFAKNELAGNALFKRARPQWERYIRSFERGPSEGSAERCIASPTCFHNHEAVQTTAEVALLKTGLRSNDPRSPLHNPPRLERRLLREVNHGVPDFVGRSGTLTGEQRFTHIGLLSDTGSWPLAYHGLSTAMYAISLQGLPAARTIPGRTALRGAARASLGLMAPDGDVTWLGRRQQEAWALAAETVVGLTGAKLLRIPGRERTQLRTMARVGFARLALLHPIDDDGLANTPRPAYDGDFSRGIQADPINFNGLTIFLLNLAADRAGTYRTSTIPMLTDARLTVRDQSAFASVRYGKTWYAVRRLGPRSDLRYDFGLLSLKLLAGDGWHDLLSAPPVTGSGTAGDGQTQVGPVIVRDGVRYEPLGVRFEPGAGGATTIVTSYQRAGRASFTIPLVYRPTADGLVLELTTQPTDVVELTSFHPTRDVQLFDDGVGDKAARTTVTGLREVTKRGGFVSCCEPSLTAVTLRVAPDAAGRVTYTVAPAAPLPAIGP